AAAPTSVRARVDRLVAGDPARLVPVDPGRRDGLPVELADPPVSAPGLRALALQHLLRCGELGAVGLEVGGCHRQSCLPVGVGPRGAGREAPTRLSRAKTGKAQDETVVDLERERRRAGA